MTAVGRYLRENPLAVLPAFVLLYGYGTIDVLDFYTLSANPLQLNPEVHKQFLQSSALPYFLGYPLTRLAGPRLSFAIVMLAGLALFAYALRRFTSIRYGARANDAALMFLAAPIFIVLTQYLGKSDAYLTSFVLLLVSGVNPVLQAAYAALAVVSHFEIGLIVLAGLVWLRLVKPATTVVGGIAGALLVLTYHYVLLPAPPQSRADLGASYLLDAIQLALATPVLHLVWTFGPFWWIVSRAWPLDWPWFVAAAVAFVLATSTLDFTRVFVLVALPVLIATVDRVIAELHDDEPAWLRVLPMLPFVQVQLISSLVYDSRIPELVRKFTER